MSKKSSSQNQPSAPTPEHNNDESKLDTAFECNICLETAKDAVVSMCGHLFCWPCLHQWLSTTDTNTQSHKTCPVCKAAISRDQVIPIYGRGGDETNRQDPREKLPPRPSGQRTEVPNQTNPYITILTNVGSVGTRFSFPNSNVLHAIIGFNSQNLLSYFLAIAHELTTTDHSNDLDYFLMRIFFIIGVILVITPLYLM